MRVLVVTNIFPSKRNPFSGTYVAEQVNAFDSCVSIQVVAKTHKSALGLLPFFVRSAWYCRTAKYDLIHAHYGFHSAIVPVLLAHAPVIITFHGSDALVEPQRHWMYRILQRTVVSRAAHIIAVSEQLQKALIDGLDADPRKVSVVPCGVDTDRFRPRPKEQIRSNLGIAQESKMALFIGRFTTEKGVDTIRKASENLRNVEFHFIGDGPIQWAAPNCRFLGALPHSEISEWVNAADVLLLPSQSEGTPVSVLEALASSIPVICTRVGACPQMISEGVTGLFVPYGDAEALTNAIRSALFDMVFDMAQGRQFVVDKYCLEETSGKLSKLYAKVLADHTNHV